MMLLVRPRGSLGAAPPVSAWHPARPGPDAGKIRVGSVGSRRVSHWDAQAAGPSPSPIILV